MDFGIAFIRKSIETIARSRLSFFSRFRIGDKSGFDQRGAFFIRKGEKSISEASGESDGMVIYRPGGTQTVPPQKAMDSHYGWVYACVKAISNEMANIQFRMFSITEDGEHEEIESHELLDLLDGVNEYQTGPEFRKVLSSHLELTGNAYVYLFGVKNFNDKPKSLYLLPPGRVKIIVNKTVFPYKLVRYEMVDNDRKFTFEPHEIVHFKYPDPNDPMTGLGTVGGVAEWIDADNYAMEFNKNFFRNGARLNGYFKTDYTSFEQAQRLKIAFEEQFAGVKNAYKTLVMPKGVEFKSAQATSKEMDFAKLLETTRDRILAAFCVSKTILGTAESDTNRATAETADYVFAKRTIKPKMEMIVSTINEFIVPRYADNIYIGFNDPVPEDKAFRTEEMKAAVGGAPVLTADEARQEFMGLGPIEGGDKLLRPSTMSAADGSEADESGDGKNPKPNEEDDEDEEKSAKKSVKAVRTVRYGKVAGKKRGKPSFKTQFSRNMKIRKEMGTILANVLAEKLAKIAKKDLVEMTDDEFIEAVWTHTEARMDEYEPKLKAAIAGVADRQEKEVLRNLPNALKGIAKKEVDPKKLFEKDRWISITIQSIEPIMSELFSKEFLAAATAVGTPEAQISAHIREMLTERMNLLGRSYNDTIIELLTNKLNEGISNGMSRLQLADLVKDIYTWSKDYQAERIAKTETVAVSNMANKGAWQAGGRIQTVKWYTSQKDNVCPFCQEMAGTVVDINQNFLDLGGEFTGANGETMTADYSAITAPPLHPNCGCLIRPASWKPLA